MSERTPCTCGEAFQRLDDYLDRELSAEEMDMVRAHLEVCRACASEFKFEGSVLQCLKKKLAHIDLPSDLLEKMRAALDECDK